MSCSVWNKIGTALVVILLFVQVDCYAQACADVSQYVQLNTLLSDGDNAPFWLAANRQGVSSLDASSGYARYGIAVNGEFASDGRWKYSAGADVIAGYNQLNALALQ